MSLVNYARQFVIVFREICLFVCASPSSRVRRVIGDPLFVSRRGVLHALLTYYDVIRATTLGHQLNSAYTQGFDSEWYEERYTDVRYSSLQPFIHFVYHGRQEGRLACDCRLDRYFELLKLGKPELMLQKIKLVASVSENAETLHKALGMLTLWYLVRNEIELSSVYADRLFQSVIDKKVRLQPSTLSVLTDIALKQNNAEQATVLLSLFDEWWEGSSERFLLKANFGLMFDVDKERSWLKQMNFLANSFGCSSFELKNNFGLSSLSNTPLKRDNHELSIESLALVSIIVPVFNAENTIGMVLDSINRQTYKNIEVVLVDDSSTDNTRWVIQNWVTNRKLRFRMRIINNSCNRGAYYSRNVGMSAASGAYLTVNDSDDWAHCEKIERQVKFFGNAPYAATVSSGCRVTDSLMFKRRGFEKSLVQRNVSSLMIRKELLSTIGYWDEVKANADTEYYYRIISVSGDKSIGHVLEHFPLSLQLVREGSLTASKDIGLDTMFHGPRKWYIDSAFDWHQRCKPNLFIDKGLKNRKFFVPDLLKTDDEQLNPEQNSEQWMQSDFWDPAWYVQRYHDVQEGGIEAFEHYLSIGRGENRDTSPLFSASSYALLNDINPGDSLFHFLKFKSLSDSVFYGQFKGRLKMLENKNVLLVGHQAGEEIFGAERSLVDLAKMVSNLGFNVTILLPEIKNKDYLEMLLSVSCEVLVVPFTWWFYGKVANLETVSLMKRIFEEKSISLVHVNTIVVDEALIAAKELNIPSVVHIREDLSTDPNLCEVLMSSPKASIEHLSDCNASLLCNSRYCLEQTKKFLHSDFYKDVDYIYNLIEPNDDAEVSCNDTDKLRIGILSSNIEKKGLEDFAYIASSFKGDTRYLFKVFGPKTALLESLMRKNDINFEYAGYVVEPAIALKSLDIVLSLSQFSETFGRTVAEAQFFQNVAIAYRTGAISELILNGETGFLVKPKDFESIKNTIRLLREKPDVRQRIGVNAKHFARTSFSRQVLQDRLNLFYQNLLARHS